MTDFEISVVICTRDQRAGLIESLEALSHQTCRGAWEVVVVDNGSRDGSRQAVEALADHFPVPLVVVSEARPGLSHARNRGAQEARGESVVYIDDDVTCLGGWLEAHRQALAHASVEATGGPVEPLLPPATPGWLEARIQSEVGGPTARYDFGPTAATIREGSGILLPFGCNMGIRRRRIAELGGFRSDLGWGPRRIPGEDTALLRSLREHGGEIRYCPDARVIHRIHPEKLAPESYLRWYRGYGRASIRFDAPETSGRRAIGIARDLVRIARHSALALASRPDTASGLERRCRRERAIGRLIERLAPGHADV